ncbi:MAG: protein related to regulatory domain of methyltransferase [Planctomycetota bacterium]|nr:protein related to regulatory domain of methyltransferase [Planctomycetota bacterium]
MPEDNGNSYDEVPYQSVALNETHPERLASVATLFGLDATPVESCRVLEMGCASGGNLIPLAQLLPESHFVGIDLSNRQINTAIATAQTVGATNVEFHAMSLADVTRELGTFDYILCHGVYSWVPDGVKSAILRICSENLSKNGVAYVSYNTLPGWHIPGMVREMMLYHVRNMSDPNAKVKAARAFLDFLGQSIPDREGPYAKTLIEEAVQLRPHADSYVLHEHLEDLNHPIYYHEFASRAADHGLKVFSDSRVWATAVAVQPPMAAVLDKVARDPIDRDQYFDFICNRRFRRSLLCRADVELLPVPAIERLKKLRASASVWPTTSPTDFASRTTVDFRAGDGMIRLSTIDPLFKTALLILSELYPRSVEFEELWSMIRHRLGRAGVEPGTNPDVLAQRLLQAYVANSLELHAFEPPFPLEASGTPEGFPLARLAAESGPSVPSLRHRQVTISDFDRLVIRQLDGTRSHHEIIDRLVNAVTEGAFAINENGLPVRDPIVVRPILERSLGPCLQRLNRAGLLVR